MIKFFKKNLSVPPHIAVGSLLFLFSFLIIGFCSYQVSLAQTTSTLSKPPISLCARDLKFGMVSPDVKELQKYLNNNGSSLAQTGVGSKGHETNNFANLTKDALTKFQNNNKISATIGVFDLATRDFLGCSKISTVFEFTRDLKPGMDGNDVKELQKYLNNNGFPLAQTGVGSKGYETNFFGPLTKVALVKFQNAKLQTSLDTTKLKTETGNLFVDTRKIINNEQSPLPVLSYTLTYTGGSGGTITGASSQTIVSGGNGTAITAVPNNYYRFTNWSDGLTTNPRVDNNITANKSITANFSRYYFGGGGWGGSSPSVTTYTLTYTASTGGTISGTASQTVNSGSSGSAVTAVPDAGYAFVSWSDAVATASRTDSSVIANKSVTASFAAASQILTFESNDGSAVTAITQDFGTAVSAPSAPIKSGYTFENWYNEIGLTTPHTFSTMGLSTTTFAKWTVNTYTVTFDGNTNTGGTTATQTLTYNTATALTSNGFTKTGYTFAGWSTTSGGAVEYADGASYTIGAGNITLFAKWTALVPITAIGAITGTTQVGSVLTAGALTPSGATVTYQWQNATTSGGVYSNISDATTSTYTLVAGDLGKYIKVVVTGTGNYNGTTTSIASSVILGTYTYNGSPFTFGIVTNPTTNKVWLDRNLGATRVALSSTDSSAYGDLFQWGRLADGHQIRTSVTTATLSGADSPGNTNFILSSGNWRSPKNDNLWQGISGTNNPCPTGFRLPTDTELIAEKESWSSNNAAEAFASPLKLTVADARKKEDGSLYGGGSGGYWSSTVGDVGSWLLGFNIGSAAMYGGYRGDGLSVRCIQD